ncbi:MAG: DUF1493 family protein [Bacteroidetes bacterium]|nr:DUF1493 family protein [Bacteroidota bacterium]
MKIKVTTENIIDFIEDLSGNDKIMYNSDLFGEIGIVGDDFHEMIEKYQKKFSVDMSGYLWYFHTNEEGHSIGSAFYTPPYEKVKRIPVTPFMLCNFANKGKWGLKYPVHSLPKKRFDLLINGLIAGLFFIAIIIWLIIKLS